MGKLFYSCVLFILTFFPIEIHSIHLNSYRYSLKALILVDESNQEVANKTSTSLGKLGEGIESLSSDINDLADQLSLSLKSLDSQIDATISITSKSSTALLDSEIQDREHELARVNKMIQEIESNLAETKGTCSDYSTCDGCVLQSSCIWCNSERTCMTGNEEGPYSGNCNSWEYSTCNQAGCADHTECEDCMANSECGWCQNGAYCLEGGPENTGTCEKSFFYHAYSDGKDMCPSQSTTSTSSQYTETDNYINTKVSKTSNEAITEQESTLKELKDYAAVLQSEIEQLNEDKSSINEESEEGSSIEVSDIDIGDALTGLSQDVDLKYQEERQEDKQYMKQVAEDSASEVITNTYNKVDESTQIIVDNADENKQQILDEMARYSQEAQDMYQKEKQTAEEEAQKRKEQKQAEETAQQNGQTGQTTGSEEGQTEETSQEEESPESEAIVIEETPTQGNSEETETSSEESTGDSSIGSDDGSEPITDNQTQEAEITEGEAETTEAETTQGETETTEEATEAETTEEATEAESTEEATDAGSTEEATEAGSTEAETTDAETTEEATEAESTEEATDAETTEEATEAETTEAEGESSSVSVLQLSTSYSHSSSSKYLNFLPS